MKITIIETDKPKKFGDLCPGDVFYVKEEDIDGSGAWIPQNPYIKICESNEDSNGAAFSLNNLYEDEFVDDELVRVYTDFKFCFRAYQLYCRFKFKISVDTNEFIINKLIFI